ncbi:condensation domain-containing protein [Streptomyces sp. B22F1]|uniref:condensation domain-containing protein n=1 Tax=Streptomyces sp. B22F1 TaxID=3153566 RepID=UPI00325C6431
MPAVEKTFPLNTAQLRNLRNWLPRERAEKVIPLVIVPAGPLDPHHVQQALEQLVLRHEALRSRILLDVEADGRWVQQVLAHEDVTGSLAVFVPVTTGAEVRQHARSAPLPVEPTQEAVRAMICIRDGVVCLLKISLSHVFTDAIGARAVENDLRALLATDGVVLPPAPQASSFARGPADPTVRANTERWQALLARAPRTCTFAPASRESHERVEHAVLPLPAASTRGLAAFCEGSGRPASLVWTAIGSALVQILTGQCDQVFRSTYGNRTRPDSLAAVAQLAQATYVPLQGSACDSFRNRLDMIARAVLPTYRLGEYDANALLDWLNAPENARGTVFQPAFEMNYVPPMPGDAAERGDPVSAETYQSWMRIDPLAGKADLALSITHEPDPVLLLSARRPLALHRGAEQLAQDCLQLLRALITSPDSRIALSGVSRLHTLAGLTPHHSGAMIDLEAIERMVLSVPGVRSCRLSIRRCGEACSVHAHVHGRNFGGPENLLSLLRSRQRWHSGCVVPDSIDLAH